MLSAFIPNNIDSLKGFIYSSLDVFFMQCVLLRAVAQWPARLVRDQEIGGSSPLSPIISCFPE